MARLTVKQAAAALAVSTKTIRRRIAEGALSATRELRGKQELVLVDGAELARYAEVANLRLDVDKLGQSTDGEALSKGQRDPNHPTESTVDLSLAETVQGLTVDTTVDTAVLRGQVRSLQDTVSELRTALDAAKQREAWLQERIKAAEEAAEAERQRMAGERSELLSRIPKALPPAAPWWTRIFRGKGDGADG